MKPEQIQVGKTYRNRGKGKTTRKVLAIGNEHRPRMWFGGWDEKRGDMSLPPNEPGVLYEQKGKTSTLYISSFADWCGSEV